MSDTAQPQPSADSAQAQVDRLAQFIMDEVPGEPSQSQGAVDTAIRLLRGAYVERPTRIIPGQSERLWHPAPPHAIWPFRCAARHPDAGRCRRGRWHRGDHWANDCFWPEHYDGDCPAGGSHSFEFLTAADQQDDSGRRFYDVWACAECGTPAEQGEQS